MFLYIKFIFIFSFIYIIMFSLIKGTWNKLF
jgi:hypothetical protein